MTIETIAPVARIWCAEVDLGVGMPAVLRAPEPAADDAAGMPYDEARVLVRLHGESLMFVQRALVDGALSTDGLLEDITGPARERLLAHLAADGGAIELTTVGERAVVAVDCQLPAPTADSVTVVVCTRGRGEALRECLAKLKVMNNDGLDFVIVDNAPVDNSTAEAFDAEVGDDPRFSYVVEPRPGLSCARNRGLAEARGSIIAYTDDDVSVDAGWVTALLAGFDRRPDVACVTSLVCTASLETPAEHYFDARVSWAERCEAEIYDSVPPENDFLYPYSPGLFGTGAGMAFRTQVVRDMGGFDEALGAGTRTAGGEDLDAFVRVLQAGYALAYEPSSVVWHHHRADLAGLQKQMYAYGTGLTAFMTKHLIGSSTRGSVLRRIPRGVVKLATVPKKTHEAVGVVAVPTKSLLLREIAGMAMGPALYGVARRNIPEQASSLVESV